MTENFANRYQTTLSAGVTSGALSGIVTSVTGIPTVPFRAIISAESNNADEIVLVTNVASSTLTWTRAAEPIAGVQTPSAHKSGATFTAIVSATGFYSALSILPASDGVDDTAELNALLSVGGMFRGRPGTTYRISAPLVIPSDSTLDMTDCTVVLIDGSTCNMLQNQAVTTARTVMDANITATSTTVTSATAAFTGLDIGHWLWVWGGGPLGELLEATIASVTNSTTAELTNPAISTVVNGQASIGFRDANITVIGGQWDRGANGRGDAAAQALQDNRGQNLRFRRVDHIVVRDLSITGGLSDAADAVSFADCTDFMSDGIYLDHYLSGGVHVAGPARRGRISNVSGYTMDDMVAITPTDWPFGLQDVWGDVSEITIENVRCNNSASTIVAVIGGSATFGTSCKHIRVRNVTGLDYNTSQGQGGLVWIGDSPADPSTVGGFLDDVTVELVSGTPAGTNPSSKGLVYLNPTNGGRIQLAGLSVNVPTGVVQHGVIIGPSTVLGYLTVSNSTIVSVDGGCDLINYDVATGITLSNVRYDRCALRVNGVWSLLDGGLNYAGTIANMAGLVLHWRLGEASGTTVVDASGNGYTGTYVGTPTLGGAGLLVADSDTAWTGNGTDTSITGPTIPALAAWSLVFWAKSNGANADFAGYFSTASDQFDIGRPAAGATGQVHFYDGAWTTLAGFIVDTSATMFALTYTAAAGLRIYKNGVLAENAPTHGRALANEAFNLGAQGGARTIDTLDEFAIFSRAITATEVALLWQAGS